jgi:CheY-like chemotaxis protein
MSIDRAAILPVTDGGTVMAPKVRAIRVLIIDDDIDGADALRDLLSLLMFGQGDIAIAHSGEDGLQMVPKLRPGLVLCDIGLPKMDGYQVARAFRADSALERTPMRLVALTGYGQPEDFQLTADAGFDLHLVKPPAPERLEEILRNIDS